MKPRTLFRHLRETGKNLWRHRFHTLATLSTVAVTLFLVGAVYLLVQNVDNLSREVEGEVVIRVFAPVGAKAEEIDRLEAALKALPGVASVAYISPQEGLERLSERYGPELKDIFAQDIRAEETLPPSFVVRASEPRDVPELAAAIEGLPGVDAVRYGAEWVDKLFLWTSILRSTAFVLLALLAFTAVYLIMNTVRLTIYMRREEVELMRLVGATGLYIRLPFFFEGLLLGTVGALIPFFLLAEGYRALVRYVQENFAFIPLLTPEAVQGTLLVLLLGVGVGIGAGGSLLSIRRYLHV
ncbi:MAG: ABC transporter permease [Brockia lithotrophica]|nr:ABC transporter permease [Brockia lithotrophica]